MQTDEDHAQDHSQEDTSSVGSDKGNAVAESGEMENKIQITGRAREREFRNHAEIGNAQEIQRDTGQNHQVQPASQSNGVVIICIVTQLLSMESGRHHRGISNMDHSKLSPFIFASLT